MNMNVRLLYKNCALHVKDREMVEFLLLEKYYIKRWTILMRESFAIDESGLSEEQFERCITEFERMVVHLKEVAHRDPRMSRDIVETGAKMVNSIGKLTRKISRNEPSLGFVWIKCSHNAVLICSSCCEEKSKEEGSLRKCSGCNKTFYCSAECQQIHWKALHNRRCAEKFNDEDFACMLAPDCLVRDEFSMIVIGSIIL